MLDFCIIGSGISGSTIAQNLSKKYKVEVFDKARGLGGRSSNRRYKDSLTFDHGLQYINPKSKLFNNFVIYLKKKNVLKLWGGNHIDFNLANKEKDLKYIGLRGNNDICKFLLKGINVNLNFKVSKIIFKKNYWKIVSDNSTVNCKNLILSLPYTQSLSLGKKYFNNHFKNLNVKMEPNITVMAVFKKNINLPISSIRFSNKDISWAANENSKGRFKSNLNLWTIQASNTYSKKLINKYKSKKSMISINIIKKFSLLTGIDYKNLIFNNIHGWKYSYNFTKTKYSFYWDKKNKLGVCGDWFLGSKAENAWLSARNLVLHIKKNPPKNNF